ncbi:ABC-type nickel/cobalt efflux system permease component RcnA [Pseudomonas sp. 3296]|jgi:hypothetical protein|uniref:hypothetical protein n=1 Tax=Pseudomonas sp. 3296 TaxID=2817753 RepID=UPI002861AC9E|nr:hypothetical protein [Pseudomonas sp. 3296]MDR6918898.1 ABC-type nickel/cobalt efflux system permease component RcnA [Pseudomonas sp. 3296]
MFLLRFLLCLLIFVGALAATGALMLCLLLMLRFPPLLLVVGLACWILSRVLRRLFPDQRKPS